MIKQTTSLDAPLHNNMVTKSGGTGGGHHPTKNKNGNNNNEIYGDIASGGGFPTPNLK